MTVTDRAVAFFKSHGHASIPADHIILELEKWPTFLEDLTEAMEQMEDLKRRLKEAGIP